MTDCQRSRGYILEPVQKWKEQQSLFRQLANLQGLTIRDLLSQPQMQHNNKHTQSEIFTSAVNTTVNLSSPVINTKSIYTKVNPSSSPVNTRRTQHYTSTLMANTAINISSSAPVENMLITAPPEFEQLITWDTEKFKRLG